VRKTEDGGEEEGIPFKRDDDEDGGGGTKRKDFIQKKGK